jgi:radical SAM superfamily enzyme YgiQ (UPF0313 family)
MRYVGTVIRPPSEANSYILQVTYGCSHNRCTFCGTYPDKPFQVRPLEETLADIRMAKKAFPETRRVFLADGNALVLSTPRLVTVLDALAASFPRLQRVSAYANARDILQKSAEELAVLKSKRLQMLYLGLESGSDEVLQRIQKNATAEDMVRCVHHARQSDVRVSVIGILGIGGREHSREHAEATGRVVSAMDPRYLSMLTLMLVPGTRLHEQWQGREFELPEPEEMLLELRQVIQHIDGVSGCIFRTNHASNYVPLAGTLPKDKPALLANLDEALARGRTAFRPELWRGL